MKIEIEVKDLGKTINAINRAINSYSHYRVACIFGLEEENIPGSILIFLQKKADEKFGNHNSDSIKTIIDEDLSYLMEIYDQLIEIEKEENN